MIVDLDGTVWDSAPWCGALLASLGGRTAEDYERELVGGGNFVSMLRAVARPQAFPELCASREPPALYAGVLEGLEGLRSRGTTLGIATSLPAWVVEPMAKATQIERFFSVRVDASCCRARKPSPRPLLQALDLILVRPDAALYVGDRDVDCRAAKAAGMEFAWASWGYEEEPPKGCDRVLGGFADLLLL